MAGYSDPINHAFAFAAKHHDQQVRKGTRYPYLTAAPNLAVILARYGQDDSTLVAGILHDVVEDCTSCHNPHQSAEKSLLIKNVVKLCADCHDDKDLKADRGHIGIEGKSCTDCHDPHVGANANLLKPSALPK